MLVSVIITTYNRSALLPRAIDSVLNQSYRELELIIVDDCSSDNTKQVVKKYSDNKIKYIKNNKNMGLAASRNIGIKAASGEYISFLDDDDELMPGKIKKQVDMFHLNKTIGVVYCGSIRKYKNIEIENRPKYNGNIFKKTLRACPNAIHSLLIKKECFNKAGDFDESFKAFEDWDLWIRLARYYQFDYINEPLVIYNFHGHQMSVELDLKITAGKMILDKHYTHLKKEKRILHWHYRKLITRCSLAGRYDEGLKYTLRAIKAYPLNIGSYLHLLLILTCRPLQKKMIYRYGLLKIGDIYIV